MLGCFLRAILRRFEEESSCTVRIIRTRHRRRRLEGDVHVDHRALEDVCRAAWIGRLTATRSAAPRI